MQLAKDKLKMDLPKKIDVAGFICYDVCYCYTLTQAKTLCSHGIERTCARRTYMDCRQKIRHRAGKFAQLDAKWYEYPERKSTRHILFLIVLQASGFGFMVVHFSRTMGWWHLDLLMNEFVRRLDTGVKAELSFLSFVHYLLLSFDA